MKIIVSLTIGFVLLVGVILALPFLIDLNQYQDRYKPLIEEALNRKVQLQDIRLTIWPRLGARIGGVTILDDPAFSAGPFASLASLEVGVKLLPLLSKQVEVEEISLRDPVVTVITNKDGVMNMSTIGARTASSSTAEPGTVPPPGGDPLQILALFAVDRVSIEGGKLTYRDLSTAPVTEYQVQDLELLLRSVRLGQTPSIHLKATVLPYNLPVTLDGGFGPLVETLEVQQYDFALGLGKVALAVRGALVGGMLDATVSAPAINTADLPVALPLQKPVQIKDLLVTANAPYPFKQGVSPLELADISNLSLALIMGSSSVQVKGTVLNGQANVTVSSPSLNTADLPVAVPLTKPVELKGLTVTAKTRVPFKPTAPPLEIADVSDLRVAVALGQSLIHVKGTVLNGQANMTVTSPSVNTADLPIALPLAKPVELKDLTVTAKTRVPFNPAAPPLEIADVSDLRVAVALGQSLLHLKGTVLNGQANVTLSSPSLNTADLPVAVPLAKPVELKDLTVTAKTRVPFKPTAPPLEIADVSDLRLRVILGKSVVSVKGTLLAGHANVTLSSPSVQTGDLPVETGLAKSVELRNLLVNADLKGPNARLSNASFQLFDGQFKADGEMSTGSPTPPFRGKVKIDGLQLGPALAAISPNSTVSMSGTAAMDLAVTGRGFTMPDLTNALEGPGHLRIKNGKIEGINLMEEAATLLKVAGLSPDRLKTTAFSAIETDVMIKQGLVNVQKLLMDSHDFQATGAGTVGFDQALNLAVNLHLSPALSQKLAASSPIARIALKEGRLRLPFLITGTIQAPAYGLDTKELTGKVQEQVKEKVNEAVKGLLEGTTNPKDLQQQGKDLLKGLLGR
ncbi:MAG: AsmA family protein [Nitrospira sp. CG24D]|nr:MAG: AsmA family protein [Nitrospira sp. CG24D]